MGKTEMRCPKCQLLEVRVAECFEILYEVNDDGTAGQMTNADGFLDGPEDFYFCCIECWHRWDDKGHSLKPVFTVPDRC